MRGIFLRIFLSFWLAMMLIAGTSVLISFYLASRFVDDLEEMHPRRVIVEASEVLKREGRPGLEAWLDEMSGKSVSTRLFVLDEDGRELLGRALPERVERRLARMQEHRHGPWPENYLPPRFAPRIVDRAGNQYAVLVLPRRPGPFGILAMPSLRYLVLFVALIVSALVAFVLARQFSTPLRKLQSATRTLAAGELDTRVGQPLVARRDELGVLARDFDQMAARIESLMHSHQELIRNVSHELRSPLTRLQLALELARRHTTGETPELDRIENEAARLNALIAETLTLARLDDKGIRLSRAPVELGSLISEIVADARYEAGSLPEDQPPIQIDWQSDMPVEINGDRQLLHSAIENVIRNAMKYTAPGTAVSIHLEHHNGQACIRVRDRGAGVSADALQRIFEPFYRTAAARDRDSGGEGLGLAISARVVERHGGSIGATLPEGGGLEVQILLPVGAGSAPASDI